jgi:hypothetical protein
MRAGGLPCHRGLTIQNFRSRNFGSSVEWQAMSKAWWCVLGARSAKIFCCWFCFCCDGMFCFVLTGAHTLDVCILWSCLREWMRPLAQNTLAGAIARDCEARFGLEWVVSPVSVRLADVRASNF